MTSPESPRTTKRDLVIMVLVVLGIFALAATFDFNERISAWLAAHEAWELDEILIALGLGSVCFGWFSVRRWRESRDDAERRQQVNRELEAEIAARRLTEQSLRESEGWLRQAAQVAKVGHYVWDAVEDRCLFCSQEHARLHGLSPEDYVERAAKLDEAFALTHPEDRDAFKAKMRALRSGQAIEIEYRTLAPDGRVRHVREMARPVFDEAGKVVREIGTSQDITEHRRIEADIRQRDAWLRSILDNTPVQIAIKDTECRILAVSRDFWSYAGVTPENCIGKQTTDLLPKHVAEIYAKADEEVLRSGRPLLQETVEEMNGSVCYYLNAKFPLKDEAGEIIGVGSITSDITEQKLAERQLQQAQKTEALGKLTGGVAHDFNNLLAVIQGNADLLADRIGRDNPLLQAIFRASKRGADLTDRLLAFSRQQPLQPRATDLFELVRGMSAMLERTLGQTIEIETSAAADLGQVVVDPGQLENALLNLAINARDAMPDGGRLTIACENRRLDESFVTREPEAAAGDYVVVTVSDSGTGMSPAVRAKAFEPFFSTKEIGQGSGLGLSMVYGFAKQSGGHVTLRSDQGRGTSVALYLPRAEDRAQAAAGGQEAEVPKGRGETILVVEDDAEVRACAVRTLGGLGYRTVDVADAAGALALLANGGAPDLLFSDVVLPGGTSGPALAEQARRDHPGLKVVLISGYSDGNDGALGSGAVLLRKPIQVEPLARALRDALDAARDPGAADRAYTRPR